MEPLEPSGPLEPLDPLEPVKPSEPLESSDSLEPVKPSEPLEPSDSLEPLESLDPPDKCFSPIPFVGRFFQISGDPPPPLRRCKFPIFFEFPGRGEGNPPPPTHCGTRDFQKKSKFPGGGEDPPLRNQGFNIGGEHLRKNKENKNTKC